MCEDVEETTKFINSCEGDTSKQITFKVAPYSFTIARALMAKAQVICARSCISVVRFL